VIHREWHRQREQLTVACAPQADPMQRQSAAETRSLALNWTQEPTPCMPESGLIVSNPNVMMGKFVIRGTRITVELIREKFAAGYSEDEVLRAYPHITQEGIRAALAFAAEALQASVLYPLEPVGS
jgi:uncharacterized protein (DUF433 family)